MAEKLRLKLVKLSKYKQDRIAKLQHELEETKERIELIRKLAGEDSPELKSHLDYFYRKESQLQEIQYLDV